jgi:hypothetical protein
VSTLCPQPGCEWAHADSPDTRNPNRTGYCLRHPIALDNLAFGSGVLTGVGMAIFFHHVGEQGGQRDFPKTIGTRKRGLVRFQWDEVAPYLDHLSAAESRGLEQQAAAAAPNGFQVWGIPSGAKSALKNFSIGDYLLLLESAAFGGGFVYAGKAIGVPPGECWDLSRHLWGEQKFPLIVFLVGGHRGPPSGSDNQGSPNTWWCRASPSIDLRR